MKKLKFAIKINAPKEKVWEALWSEPSYKQWTAVFSQGSYAVSDWKEGSRIKFLNATGDGMYSVIEKKQINKQMTFKHLGEIINGKEKESEWAGALESYLLTEKEDGTELTAEMDTNEEYQSYFEGMFPKALEKIKHLSEKL